MRKESTARRPDVTIKYIEKKAIYLVDMAFSNEKNALEKIERKDRSISNSPLRLERVNQDTQWK